MSAPTDPSLDTALTDPPRVPPCTAGDGSRERLSVNLARQATAAFQAEQQARSARIAQSAAPDVAALMRRLTELGVTPLCEPWITGDGTVRVTIADLFGVDSGHVDLINEEGEAPAVRGLVAEAKNGRITLPGHVAAEQIELHSLADVGRALWTYSAPQQAAPDYVALAEHQLTYRTAPALQETEAICDALAGLTYAALAIAAELRDGAGIERYIGGA